MSITKLSNTASFLGRTTATLGVAAALLVSGAGLTPAVASTAPAPEVSQEEIQNISPATLEEGFAQLLASDIPRTVTGTGPSTQTTFTFEQGFELTFGRDITRAPDTGGTVTPMIGGGVDSGGLYVLLNQFDQNLVISGSGFLLGAGICAIPAVGTAACLVVGAILTVASTALALNGGTCSNNREFKVYVTGGVRPAGCV